MSDPEIVRERYKKNINTGLNLKRVAVLAFPILLMLPIDYARAVTNPFLRGMFLLGEISPQSAHFRYLLRVVLNIPRTLEISVTPVPGSPVVGVSLNTFRQLPWQSQYECRMAVVQACSSECFYDAAWVEDSSFSLQASNLAMGSPDLIQFSNCLAHGEEELPEQLDNVHSFLAAIELTLNDFFINSGFDPEEGSPQFDDSLLQERTLVTGKTRRTPGQTEGFLYSQNPQTVNQEIIHSGPGDVIALGPVPNPGDLNVMRWGHHLLIITRTTEGRTIFLISYSLALMWNLINRGSQ